MGRYRLWGATDLGRWRSWGGWGGGGGGGLPARLQVAQQLISLAGELLWPGD